MVQLTESDLATDPLACSKSLPPSSLDDHPRVPLAPLHFLILHSNLLIGSIQGSNSSSYLDEGIEAWDMFCTGSKGYQADMGHTEGICRATSPHDPAGPRTIITHRGNDINTHPKPTPAHQTSSISPRTTSAYIPESHVHIPNPSTLDLSV